jgi:hypothetical protein
MQTPDIQSFTNMQTSDIQSFTNIQTSDIQSLESGQPGTVAPTIQGPYRKQGDTPRVKPLTVLFTSHQAGEFELICDRLVLLDSGRKVYDGQIDQVNEHFSEEIKFFENSSKCNINKPTIDDILYMLGSKSDINGLPQDSICMSDKKRA